MPVTISLHPGVVFDAATPITIAILNQLFSAGYATMDSGTIDNANITDGAITGAKVNATFDLTGKTLTLPVNRQPKTAITAASTVPDFIGQIGLTAANVAYVAYGTSAGNWYRIDINDALASIAAAPVRIGQFAYAGGILYLAKGVATVADWIELNPTVYYLPDQGSDPAAPTAACKIYSKGGSLYVRTPAGIVNISGGATTVQSAITPNYDSGWTHVEKNKSYLLSSTSFGSIETTGTLEAVSGGFSRDNADKNNATYGTAVCTTSDFSTLFAPSVDYTGFRFIRIMVKKVTTGGTDFSSYVVVDSSISGLGYGIALYWENTSSDMVLVAGSSGCYQSPNSNDIGDWETYILQNALVRIQAWL